MGLLEFSGDNYALRNFSLDINYFYYGEIMKYFFLSEHWTTGRVWEFGGLWNELAWHRKPHLRRRSLCITEHSETLCLYEAEESILMVEVIPKIVASHTSNPAIGQVVLKRLLSAEQAIERLCQEDDIFQHSARHCRNVSLEASTIQTVPKQPAQHSATDNTRNGSISFELKESSLTADEQQKSQASIGGGEASPELEIGVMKASHANQEPVAINDYSDQN
ncbi:MAG: hypothetical protein AAFO84_16310 [Cyanobacteria bacterium J06598_1]